MSCIIGIDYGQRKIGISLSDESETIAQVLETLENKSEELVFESIKRLIDENNAKKIVFGLPLSMSGGELEQAKIVKEFAFEIQERFKIEIDFQDERLSTTEAKKILIEKKKKAREDDAQSAQIILQTYLDKVKSKKVESLDFSSEMHKGMKPDGKEVKLSVIIPARNESKRIVPTLKEIDSYLEKQPYLYEIIVVDNASTDGTADVVKKYRDVVEHSGVYGIASCPGKGCAVQRGIMHARGKYLLFMDADNATKITEIEKAWPKFKQGYDVIIGSRRIKGSVIADKQPFIRELAGRVSNVLIQIMAVPGIKDTQCGFKAFTRESALDIFTAITIERWGFDIEVLAIAKKWKYKIVEIPVTWHHVGSELIKVNSYFNTLSDLIKIRWNLCTGEYEKLRGDKNAKDRFKA